MASNIVNSFQKLRNESVPNYPLCVFYRELKDFRQDLTDAELVQFHYQAALQTNSY